MTSHYYYNIPYFQHTVEYTPYFPDYMLKSEYCKFAQSIIQLKLCLHKFYPFCNSKHKYEQFLKFGMSKYCEHFKTFDVIRIRPIIGPTLCINDILSILMLCCSMLLILYYYVHAWTIEVKLFQSHIKTQRSGVCKSLRAYINNADKYIIKHCFFRFVN